MTAGIRMIVALALLGIIMLLAAQGERIGQVIGLAPAPRITISLHE